MACSDSPTDWLKSIASDDAIAFASGFEVFAPFTEGLGELFAKNLFPQFAKAATSSLIPLGQHAASQVAAVGKDGWALPTLATGGSSDTSGKFWNLFSMNLVLDLAPELFYSKYVISRV